MTTEPYIRDRWLAEALTQVETGAMTREEIIGAFVGAAAVILGTYRADIRDQMLDVYVRGLRDATAARAKEIVSKGAH